jgi:hypothetical protein
MIFSDFVVYGILPFMLVFVIVFAILQKSKVLGEDKQQIDALVSLVIGLILVVVPGPQKEIIVSIMPWLAVALCVLLVFFILYGFVAGELKSMPSWMKNSFIAMAFIFTIALIYYLTNIEVLIDEWTNGSSGTFVTNIFILGLVIGGIWWAIKAND